MNKPLFIGAFAALAATAAVTATAKPAKDPVLMTVNGKDVKLSEFEYLFHKNNSQQIQPQTLDEYVDMFVTYKLKVADAEAAGIDTTAAFINEFTGYRDDLADPYLNDVAFEDSLMRVAYSHLRESVDVSHIMVPLQAPNSTHDTYAELDSLRNLVLGGADFAQLARRHSADQSARSNGGHLGYIVGGQYPYEFEEVAYSTPEGEVSPIFDTRYGHHFIKAGGRKPNPGEVHVRHILKLTRGMKPEAAEAKKQEVDSLYNLIKNGADFAEVARKASEDPGSARNGGDLPWFSLGRMVPDFERVAFALADGEVSEPFQTSYGWHIVQRLEHRQLPEFEKMKGDIRKAMDRDVRGVRIKERRMAQLEKRFPVAVNEATAEKAKAILGTNGLDSIARVNLGNLDLVAATAGNQSVMLAYVVEAMAARQFAVEQAALVYDQALKQLTDEALLVQGREALPGENEEYRNLIGEYRDGMLLYEISNRNVWDRASKDTEGLQRYFEANRGNYTWQKPHYKGHVILVTNDSVGALARDFLKGTNYTVTDSLNSALRERFGKDAKAEFVVTAQGDNAIVDYVAFNGPLPAPQKGRRLNAWIPYNGRIITVPEEATDVKGVVSTDYQQQLEREWVEQLHKKYPVKINKKVLKKVK